MSTRTSLAVRVRSPVRPPRSRSSSATGRLASSSLASSGRSSRSASATTIPTSSIVSVTVSWLRLNTAPCRSRAPPRNRLANAFPPTTPDTAETTAGRTASRSGFPRTSSSVTRSAIWSRTLGSCSATVARSAKRSLSKSTRHAYAPNVAATSSTHVVARRPSVAMRRAFTLAASLPAGEEPTTGASVRCGA